MNPAGQRRARVLGPVLILALVGLALGGCSAVGWRPSAPPPGRTTLALPWVELPARRVGAYLILETKGDRQGPYRFLIDTGSSVTLATPALVRRLPGPARTDAPRVRVAGADGTVAELPAAALGQLQLGDARFENVPVLVHDCAALSAHLGLRIDAVLGFPLFRDTLLTLDYPRSRVVLRPAETTALPPGSVLPFDDSRKTPLIPLRVGERSVTVLIDSGSDAAFSLNPAGLDLAYAEPPRPGGAVATLAGDRPQRIARLAGELRLGEQVFQRPVVDLTDELSSLGAGALRHFAVTFDQRRDRVHFERTEAVPITEAARRSAGLGFSRTPAYWRVTGVIAGSPAAVAGVREGDLVTRIEGEPVGQWDLDRYQRRVDAGGEIRFAFLQGNAEAERPLRVFDLVP